MSRSSGRSGRIWKFSPRAEQNYCIINGSHRQFWQIPSSQILCSRRQARQKSVENIGPIITNVQIVIFEDISSKLGECSAPHHMYPESWHHSLQGHLGGSQQSPPQWSVRMSWSSGRVEDPPGAYLPEMMEHDWSQVFWALWRELILVQLTVVLCPV